MSGKTALYGPPAKGAELRRREVMWAALSDLFLDSEITDAAIARIARTARAEGFGIEEIEAMLVYEVAPALWSNLYATAGVWDAFDPLLLSRGIRRNWRRPLHRWRSRRTAALLRSDFLEPELARIRAALARAT